jgi:hypothetical protein
MTGRDKYAFRLYNWLNRSFSPHASLFKTPYGYAVITWTGQQWRTRWFDEVIDAENLPIGYVRVGAGPAA